MSYILDALKKAERDRLREDPKELDDFASANWDPYQQTAQTNTSQFVVIAIGLLLLLLGLVIYLGSLSEDIKANPQAQVPAQRVIVTAEKIATSGEEKAPQLRISGHIFIAEGSPSNRLFANQKTYRVGDKLERSGTLVAIKSQGYEVSFNDRVESRPYR